jgi:hypothetical protein
VLSRWKEYFEQHLNESSEEEQHANHEPLRENDVIIDLPSRDEIDETKKILERQKLLKSGGPSLVIALNEMIQQVWIGETLLESWAEGLLCPVYKKGDKLGAASAY